MRDIEKLREIGRQARAKVPEYERGRWFSRLFRKLRFRSAGTTEAIIESV